YQPFITNEPSGCRMPLGGESGAPRLTLSTCTGTVPAGGETIFAIIIKHRKHGFQITIKTNRVKIVIRLP
ncbi:hypothetical protein, partial [Methanomethylophilus alvi]|uniref:hypothetical protein n=2 Tax=Methanomethylophilus alvi TaxID=1291540 RepID=UPI0037DC4BC4